MKTSLLNEIPKGMKGEYDSSYKSGRLFREVLSSRIEKEIESMRKSAISKDSYSNPNWPYVQSDLIGGERKLRWILEIINEK
jgi:hypothetical protein